jgi:hypothetical protein
VPAVSRADNSPKQTTLNILSHAFSSLTGCEISLCITYKLETYHHNSFPLRRFQELENGMHTLCNEMVPTTEAAIREFLDQSGPVLPFDMSIDYIRDEDITSKALASVRYRPSLANAVSASDTSPAQESLACNFCPEEIELAYLHAMEAAREGGENERF